MSISLCQSFSLSQPPHLSLDFRGFVSNRRAVFCIKHTSTSTSNSTSFPCSSFPFLFLFMAFVSHSFLFYNIFHFSFVSTTAPKPPNGSHPTLKPVHTLNRLFCLISLTLCMSSIFSNIQDPLWLDAIVFCLFLCRCLYNFSSVYQ